MAEPHRHKGRSAYNVVRGNFAVYTGKTRRFPNAKQMILVEKDVVYEIAIFPPDRCYTFYQVRVRTLDGDVYLPYYTTSDIWEDWMPYGGEVNDDEKEAAAI